CLPGGIRPVAGSALRRGAVGVHDVHRELPAKRADSERVVLAGRGELRQQGFRIRGRPVPQGRRRVPAVREGARCLAETRLLPLRARAMGQGTRGPAGRRVAFPRTSCCRACQRTAGTDDTGKPLRNRRPVDGTGRRSWQWYHGAWPFARNAMTADPRTASARVRAEVPAARRLRITEIFHSLQGESRTAGLPTVFVRLTGCPLRCSYCDTEYAFYGGHWRAFDDILDEVAQAGAKHVCVTGGEPLAQRSCIGLL